MKTTLAWVAIVGSLMLGLLWGPRAAVEAAAGQAPAQDAALVERGRTVYEYWCATCHAAGRGMPGTAALAVKYRDGSLPAVLEERVDLAGQTVRFFVRNGVSVMPFFRKTEVSDADLEAIAAYLARNRGK